jgi:D-glutamate cyclase
MTTDEKLAAILAAVQTDPGNRGLARDPHDNLFTATKGDFQAACRSIAESVEDAIDIDTGFFIPSTDPPAFETDGPLGSVFLLRALSPILLQVAVWSPPECGQAVLAGARAAGLSVEYRVIENAASSNPSVVQHGSWPGYETFLSIALEHVGRATDGRYYNMRGRDITSYTAVVDTDYLLPKTESRTTTIGIGDGGNEIGMGKIPHETVVKNIPNGDLIHCRVPTDHLIVCGVSNWGAYALAAGVYVLRGVKPPADLFDPDREREILEVMVREGPLVDGVTGQQTATVDGLTWDEYAKPLIRIREILES